MWFDLILIFVALVPLLLTRPTHTGNLPSITH
jgi:hypothetical protein